MSWFLITLIGPLLYAMTNHIDKFLLSKYFKEGGVGTLILFSSLLSAISLPFIYIQSTGSLLIEPLNAVIMCVVGLLNIGVLWFYLLALDQDEASTIIVFYQLVPVFAYMLGYILLGETLTTIQLLAMAIIIFGATIISFELGEERKLQLKFATVFYMICACLCWAAGSVIFKYVALEETIWNTLFWEYIMLTLVGIVIFVFVKDYRHHFLTALRTNSGPIISLNILNEVLFIAGNLVFSFSYMLAPIALVLLVGSFQPFFVLMIGITLTLLFPKISKEKITTAHLTQKIIAILVTSFGTYLLFM